MLEPVQQTSLGNYSVRIDYAPSSATQIILRFRLPDERRRRLLVLGNTAEEKADGRQVLGGRLPVRSRCPTGRKTGPRRFLEPTNHGIRLEISPLIQIDVFSPCRSARVSDIRQEKTVPFKQYKNNIFSPQRCILCKKKERRRWDFSLRVSAFSVSTFRTGCLSSREWLPLSSFLSGGREIGLDAEIRADEKVGIN